MKYKIKIKTKLHQETGKRKENKKPRRCSFDDFLKSLLLSHRVLKNMSNRLPGYYDVRDEQITTLFNSGNLERCARKLPPHRKN